MFDVALPELLVIGAVALVVIGPKDLPKVMHKLGQWAGTARRAMIALQHDMERLGYEAEQAEKEKKTEKPDSHDPPTGGPL